MDLVPAEEVRTMWVSKPGAKWEYLRSAKEGLYPPTRRERQTGSQPKVATHVRWKTTPEERTHPISVV